jgi:predicted DNA-binding protein with PD1-like motif
MKAKLLHEVDGQRTFALVFETGDEALAGIRDFAKHQHLGASHLTGIGAFSGLVLGYFDWKKKTYRRIPVNEQVEVLSLVGNVVLKGGAPQVHAHVVAGKSDGTAHGGHLLEAHVRPTLEVVVVESPQHLRRVPDEDSGLALIDLGSQPVS